MSNKEGVYGLERAKKAGIPSIVLHHKRYATRDAFAKAMLRKVDFVCLAGSIRILSGICEEVEWGRTLKIQPFLLPKHKSVAPLLLTLETYSRRWR